MLTLISVCITFAYTFLSNTKYGWRNKLNSMKVSVISSRIIEKFRGFIQITYILSKSF